MAELRTLAKPHREPGPRDSVGDCGDHSAGMVWGRSQRPGDTGGTVAGAPGAGAGVDCGVQGIGEEAVSELEWGGGREGAGGVEGGNVGARKWRLGVKGAEEFD